MDNFKGWITSSVTSFFEENNVHVCLLPPNTTDRLQPMNISVNKPAKDFLRRRFEDWYSQQITKQLQGSKIESVDLQPINLGLPVLKELEARWMVEMAEYFADNPQIIVNDFVKAGIAGGHANEQEGEQNAGEDENDSEEYESDVMNLTCED